MIDEDFANLQKITYTSALGKDWTEILKTVGVTDRNKRLYVYSLALHTATDVFAHNTFNPATSKMIDHSENPITKVAYADDPNFISNRFACAKAMASIVIGHIKSFTPGSIEDFYTVANTAYDDLNRPFYMDKFNGKAQLVDSAYYTSHHTVFDLISTKK
jgi:minor extracellular protease Epr